MAEETLRMSRKERQRLIVMQQVEAGGLKLKEAARQMGVGYRQAKRIGARFRRRGAEGLVHASRGRISNCRIGPAFRDRVLEVYRTCYWDFGPRLAAEKMRERQRIEVHEETLRRWLIVAHLWPGRTAHRKHRRRRQRRENFGELVQLDGSDHDWFEERGPRGCLMVMIDDATGRCEALLRPAETIDAALAVLRRWIERHACRRLGIKIIAARSPQAKGRVERRNGVFQDRWVKELRLASISDIPSANAHLGPFTHALNERLAQQPLSPANHHRALYLEETRRVDNDWTFPFRGRTFQIPPQPHAPRARRRVTIRRHTDGSIRCLYHGQTIRIEEIA